jgi:putative membrane protein
MKDLVKEFLTEPERQRIEACIRKAEGTTRGEIVVMVVPVSHDYPVAGLLGAAACSIPMAIVATRLLSGLWWGGPDDLWIFLGALFPLFFLCRESVKRIHPLRRLFISGKEMDHEVREAATIQFFQKGMYRTRDETGVLLYLSVFEGKVWVLADRGITSKVPQSFWEEVIESIVKGIHERQAADAICRAVEKIRILLQEKFPLRPGDQNELPDLIIEA